MAEAVEVMRSLWPFVVGGMFGAALGYVLGYELGLHDGRNGAR